MVDAAPNSRSCQPAASQEQKTQHRPPRNPRGFRYLIMKELDTKSYDKCGCFYKEKVFFVGVLGIKTLLLWAYSKGPDSWNPPHDL